MTKYQFPCARILHAPTGTAYAVNLDTKEVFKAKQKGTNEDYHLGQGERPYEAQGGEIRKDAVTEDPMRTNVAHAMRDIRASTPLLTPGRRHPDSPDFVSGGVIPKREWDAMYAGGQPIPAFRPSRATHMEIFDLNRDGWVTLGEQLRVWPVLGTSKLLAPVKAVITAVLFGTKKLGSRFLQINTDAMWRPSGRTGLFRDDGTVNKEVADKVRASFEGRAWITEADFAKVVAEAAGRPAKGVSKRQWTTTFDVLALLNQNGERKISAEQFESFLEGSLAETAASYPDDRTGEAPLQRKLYPEVMAEAAALKAGLADGLKLLPISYLRRQLNTDRPELELTVRS